MTSWLIPLVLFMPLAAGLTQFLAGPRPMPWWPAGGLAASGLAVVLLVIGIALEGPVDHLMGGWQPPLGIRLHADGLSALMLLLTTVVVIACWFHSTAHFAADRPRLARFRALMLVLWSALNALFLSADLFNLYVTLEMVTLAAIPMILLARGRGSADAALDYLLYALLGSLLYLGGVALVYGLTGSLDTAGVAERLGAGDLAAWLAASLMLIGVLLKAAIVPFHVWLPAAHGKAPAPVSALLSALVVKAAVYLLLRLWSGPLAELPGVLAGQMLGLLGVLAIFWGGIQALRQDKLKQVVAWSTVSQLGYMLLFFPLATTLAWQGAVYHGLAHGTAKAALFLAAGNLLVCLGHDRVKQLQGAGVAVKLNLLAIGLAGLSLVGMPPSGGFVAKWLLLQAALDSGQWWLAVAVTGGGLLAAAYVFRLLQPAFDDHNPAAGTTTPLMLWRDVPPLALAGLSLLLGLLAVPLLALLGALPEGLAP